MAVKQARPTFKLIVLEAGTLIPALSLTSALLKHREETLSARTTNKGLSLLLVTVQPFLHCYFFLNLLVTFSKSYLILSIFLAVQHIHLLSCHCWKYRVSTCKCVLFSERSLQMSAHYITQKFVFLNIIKQHKV